MSSSYYSQSVTIPKHCIHYMISVLTATIASSQSVSKSVALPACILVWCSLVVLTYAWWVVDVRPDVIPVKHYGSQSSGTASY